MPKFFVEPEHIDGDTAKIYDGDVNHITKVLRLSPKSIIMVCDGKGYDYRAEITGIDKACVTLRLLEKLPCETEPGVRVTLFQGIPKAGKMEYIIEKCVELGISRIVPVITSRTVVKLGDKKAEDKKLARWRKVAAEAVKQCGRGVIPEVGDVVTLKEAVSLTTGIDLVLAPYENERETPLKQVLSANRNIHSVGFFVGPEGGFEEEEINLLQAAGAKCVTLGKRILRTETAGHTVLTAVMYELDELQ